MELKCTVQKYDWGKKGSKSSVAQLIKAANDDVQILEDESYAELWMGTHVNGPSFIKSTGESLEKYILDNETVLGNEVSEMYGKSLPFLFKVLSIGKALSIQAHPDKQLAENLHKLQPNIYKDPNHKPEIAIALTNFEALCGFRPVSEIQYFLKIIPEMCIVIGENVAHDFIGTDEANSRIHLQKCIQGLLTHHADSLEGQLLNFLERLSQMDECSREELNASLFEKLHADFPGDVGCFGIYFFNWITLKPGEALFLAPNEPHAYLSGDCVECMACSDNVVRAGLTPKLKDVPTLIEMLTYKCESGATKKFNPTRLDDFTQVFRPPIEDFAVAKIELPPGTMTYNLIPIKSAGILIIIQGTIELSNQSFNKGSVLFIPAYEKINLKILNNNVQTLMFMAFTNI
ncbi:hypothetical protein PV326_004372 [Microctonus aethiopoides]|nr:hypothetical protein PV326_004372 [Microctonus aethiopoides]